MTSRARFFSAEHIKASSFHASHELAEQALHCLELVCELSEERFPYQVKGGNSLLLILDRPKRFSIDLANRFTREKTNVTFHLSLRSKNNYPGL